MSVSRPTASVYSSPSLRILRFSNHSFKARLVVALVEQRLHPVAGILLPEAPEHLGLVPPVEGHHGCFTYTSMLHATASCSKRFCRLICRTLRICAGVRCTGCLGSGSGSGATAGACSG